MSLEHWPRPFAHGESFRESTGPGQLRVMNPDMSKPTTPLPRTSNESDSSFLKRQRSAIGAVLFGGNRSRTNSYKGSLNQAAQVPTIAIDPALSTECIARTAPTPSFRSYSSVSSFPVVQQQPPDDPFLTPPDERDELGQSSPPPSRARRPSLAPLQNAAGAAGRTLSHLGSSLNPFRSKPEPATETVKTVSRNSISTFSSAGDPFKLDRPSIYEEYTSQGRGGSEFSREHIPNYCMYEGT